MQGSAPVGREVPASSRGDNSKRSVRQINRPRHGILDIANHTAKRAAGRTHSVRPDELGRPGILGLGRVLDGIAHPRIVSVRLTPV
jgi:hypothetical protein